MWGQNLSSSPVRSQGALAQKELSNPEPKQWNSFHVSCLTSPWCQRRSNNITWSTGRKNREIQLPSGFLLPKVTKSRWHFDEIAVAAFSIRWLSDVNRAWCLMSFVVMSAILSSWQPVSWPTHHPSNLLSGNNNRVVHQSNAIWGTDKGRGWPSRRKLLVSLIASKRTRIERNYRYLKPTEWNDNWESFIIGNFQTAINHKALGYTQCSQQCVQSVLETKQQESFFNFFFF